MVLATEDALERMPAFEDGLFRPLGEWNAAFDFVRIQKDVLGRYVYVVNQFLVHVGSNVPPGQLSALSKGNFTEFTADRIASCDGASLKDLPYSSDSMTMNVRHFRILVPVAALAGILAGGGEAAAATQWKTIRTTAVKTMSLDLDGMIRSGGTSQAWELEKYSSAQISRTWEGTYHAVKSLISYDCLHRTTELLLRVYLGADGLELKRTQMQGLQFPAAVEPDSLREKMLDLACAKTKADNMAKPVAARPANKPASLVSEAAAADLPKGAAAPPVAKPADAPVKAGDKKKSGEASAKADEKSKPGDKAAPVKVALMAKAIEPEPKKETIMPVEAAVPKLRVVRRNLPRVALHHGARAAPRKPDGHDANWSYSGERGAERWGAISADYAACAEGKQQSPIDIRDGARLELEPIEFSYSPVPLRIIDNGHTVQVNVDEGRYIIVLGKRYDLKQFHFHKPAEERIGGRSYDMVAHLVHKDVDGRLAVVAILFDAGAENPFIRRLWPYLPLEPGVETRLPAVKVELDKLLPEDKAYYTFMGSLTTPPCTEGVQWIVMKIPVGISPEQVAVFSRLYPMNARPIQATNARFIKESM